MPLVTFTSGLWVAAGAAIGVGCTGRPLERATAAVIAVLAIIMASPVVA